MGGVPNAIPERTGVPAYGYPYPWSVVPYLPGAPAADADSLDLAGVAAAWTALWTRARGWALGLAVVFLAHSDDNPQLMTVGRRALERVLG